MNLKQKSKSLIFIYIICVFCLPFIFSKIIYKYYDYLHFKKNNYGHLIVPYIFWGKETAALKDPYWRVLYIKRTETTNLENKLFQIVQMKRLFAAENKNIELRICLDLPQNKLSNNVSKIFFKEISREMIPKNQVIREGIYLIDPNGYLIMFYPETTDAIKIFKDLKQLLRAS